MAAFLNAFTSYFVIIDPIGAALIFTAGPGALTLTVLLMADAPELAGQAMVLLAAATVLVITWVAALSAGWIRRAVGRTGGRGDQAPAGRHPGGAGNPVRRQRRARPAVARRDGAECLLGPLWR
ncbi:MAG: hypothetical protein EA417_07210 [Gammaproteobacteria bacterium]|nr:MAG: hypothetical protein EA417_07210 [Gammaproteobacteria bacterium]